MRPNRLATVLCVLFASARLVAQPAPEPPPDQAARMAAMVKARTLAMAVTMYHHSNGSLPGGIKALADLGYLAVDQGTPSEDGLGLVAGGVAYGYLGVAGVSSEEVPDWGDIAIAHRSLEHPFAVEPGPDNPEGGVVPVAFLDGHVEMVSLAEARWLIDDAKATFTALKDGAALPLHRQVERDAARLAAAMIAHAATHDGRLPSSWAETYDHLPATARDEPETRAQRLEIYLSPKARGATFIPPLDDTEQGRAERDEWINAHSMWRSEALGALLPRVPNTMYTVLLHARPDAWVDAPDRRQRKHVKKLALATADARGETADPEHLAVRVREARATFDAIRSGGPLPELDDAFHDLKVLSRALADYARANNGRLPADLGPVMPYVTGLWGVYDEEPARVFLVRADESPERASAMPTDEWIRQNASYVYLGDGRVRLRDLRGSGASILLHGPIDKPFEFHAMGPGRDRVPIAGPLLSSDLAGLPLYLMPAEAVDELAQQAREAILKAAGP